MQFISHSMVPLRNQEGLSERQIKHCQEAWQIICGVENYPLDVSKAVIHGSRTVFNQTQNVVYLGADVYPGKGYEARSRMSMLACLAHEQAHAERYRKGYDRPILMPDMLLDEAETSLSASFIPVLSPTDRHDLIEDARDQIEEWLRFKGE